MVKEKYERAIINKCCVCMSLIALVSAWSLLKGTSAIDINDGNVCIESNPIATPTNTYFVIVSNVSSCPQNASLDRCQTLDFYAFHKYFLSDRTFIFMSGTHFLQYEVVVDSIANLSLIGMNNDSKSLIHCNNTSAGFVFFDTILLFIDNLDFQECGIHRQDYFPMAGTIIMKGSYNSSLSRLKVTNTTGYGLLVINLNGYTSITDSLFANNVNSANFDGGNMKIVFSGCPTPHHPTYVYLHNLQFLHGNQQNRELLTTGCGGLTIDISCFNVTVHVEDSKSSHNKGYFGANMYIHILKLTNNSIVFKNVTSSYGKTDSRGAGLFIMIADNVALNDPYSCGQQLSRRSDRLLFNFTDIHVVKNVGLGAFVIEDRKYPNAHCTAQYMLIKDSHFTDNYSPQSWYSGTAVRFGYLPTSNKFNPFNLIYAFFENCTFLRNLGVSPYHGHEASIIYLEIVQNVTFANCSVGNNQLSGVQALMSNIYFKGNNSIYENKGYFGAGLTLIQNSYIYFSRNTQINFYNNHAGLVGGALFSDLDLHMPTVNPCFFQVERSSNNVLSTINIRFENNTAGHAGSAIFGGKLYNCISYRHSFSGQDVFREIFYVKNTEADPSAVTSDPFFACFCFDGKKQPNCSKHTYNVTIFPGDNFQIPIATVGSILDGTIPGVVRAVFNKHPNSNASFEPFQSAQKSDSIYCSNLNYTVYSTQRLEKFNVTAAKVSFFPTEWRFPTNQVRVTLLVCPPGFELVQSTGKCDCEKQLQIDGIHCYIASQTIVPPPGSWIGYNNNTAYKLSNKSGALFHPHCPYDYCKVDQRFVTINDTDMWCSSNRSGILCGQCSPGLSLTLGRTKCVQCTNVYLLLVIVFAVAGVALVVMLFVLRLTVSEGSMNGLIFYANIMKINESLFFPGDTKNFLSVFIAWLNLDIGIDFCFFDGMDSISKTFLQFVFPAYIWFLIVMVILLANRFARLADIVGQRAVQVLATLFLLSYTKLQRVIITILTFTTLKYPDGSVKLVWLYNGNVEYLHGQHIALFVFAILTVFLFIIPYTTLLTFFKFFQACSARRAMSWINKLKPVFDAYAGPYKDRFRFWTGFLLMTRTVLIFALAFNIQASPNQSLFIVTFTSLALLMFLGCSGGIYGKWTYNVLESASYFNIAAVSLIMLYSEQNKYVVVNASVGISFMIFVGVVIFHLCKYTKFSVCVTRIRGVLRSKNDENEQDLLFERDIGSSDEDEAVELGDEPGTLGRSNNAIGNST